ncbi:ShlB/FhaC/HecB family hemolysin secretion/activation protein [uncultured Pseudoteredinibacter sp.]|uniref:ShlB/FhaC/HecB family hemolysin secretion/activation protein n=1 Tax=uncultured Pseudoteredinibacter sp. TaxID=1641701 RepID=UPI002631EF3F|nr:ShlB/FhaC/HecB family hemolysin secretion/activation protein [uncultured Pseudoteredinibacter sp.]
MRFIKLLTTLTALVGPGFVLAQQENLSLDFFDQRFELELSQAALQPASNAADQQFDTALLKRYDKAWWMQRLPALQAELLKRERLFTEADRIEPGALSSLAQYLRLLMPELDIGAPVSIDKTRLSDVQQQALFNMVYDWKGKHDPRSTEDYLEQEDIDLAEIVENSVLRVFDANFSCLFQLSSAENRIEVSLRPQWSDCIDESRPQLLWVNELRLGEASTQQDLPIDREEVFSFLNQQKEKQTRLSNDAAHGFSLFDLNILASKLNQAFLDSSAGQRYDNVHDALITEELEVLRQQHAMSFSNLQKISETLQDYIRAQGFILAKAYIPQQDFRAADGILELAIASGYLADVYFRNINETKYRRETLLSAFAAYLDKPVSSDVSTAYFRLNDIPGLSVQAGFFEPGEENGQTRLNLGLEEEKWQLQLRSDNYGSKATGEYRVLAGFDWYNALGYGDSLNIAVLQASSPSNTSYGSAKYKFPFLELKANIVLSHEQTQYEALGGVGANKALSQGDLATSSLSMEYRWLRSKDFNFSVGASAVKKSSDTTVTLQLGDKSVVDGLETEVEGYQVDVKVDYLLSSLRALTDWRFSYFSGQQEDLKDTVISRSYEKFTLSGDTLFLLPVEVSNQPLRLNAKFQAVYSDDLLPTFERQAIGGPYGVKTFATADFTADKTIYGNLQLLANVNSWLGEGFSDDHDVSIAVFIEAAEGRLNALQGQSDSKASFQAAGLSLYYQWQENLNLELNYSFAGSKDVSTDFAELVPEPEDTVYFSLSYRI